MLRQPVAGLKHRALSPIDPRLKQWPATAGWGQGQLRRGQLITGYPAEGLNPHGIDWLRGAVSVWRSAALGHPDQQDNAKPACKPTQQPGLWSGGSAATRAIASQEHHSPPPRSPTSNRNRAENRIKRQKPSQLHQPARPDGSGYPAGRRKRAASARPPPIEIKTPSACARTENAGITARKPWAMPPGAPSMGCTPGAGFPTPAPPRFPPRGQQTRGHHDTREND